MYLEALEVRTLRWELFFRVITVQRDELENKSQDHFNDSIKHIWEKNKIP